MRRVNCAVYSAEKVFPEDKLRLAYSFITKHPVEGVFVNNGCISFIDSPEILWTIPEIYLAYEAYSQAALNNFSYYVVKNSDGIPQLFISKAFKGHRLLVNAFTMKTIIIGQKLLVNKVASMIDKTTSNLYCVNLFNTLQAIETGSAKFLQAIIVDRDTEDEFLAVSPMTTCLSEMTTWYSKDIIDELRTVSENHETETESLKFEGDKIVRKDLPNSWQPMSTEHVKYILETYDKTIEKKNNYICIYDEMSNPMLYFSTNYRYLVNADTFECVVIRNQHTKNLLVDFATRNNIQAGQLLMAWMLAKTE
jgi:hypothetical protein